MAAGKPVIAARAAAIPGSGSKRNYLVEPENPRSAGRSDISPLPGPRASDARLAQPGLWDVRTIRDGETGSRTLSGPRSVQGSLPFSLAEVEGIG